MAAALSEFLSFCRGHRDLVAGSVKMRGSTLLCDVAPDFAVEDCIQLMVQGPTISAVHVNFAGNHYLH